MKGVVRTAVVGVARDAVGTRESFGGTDKRGRNSQIVVHVENIVKHLVPDLARGHPMFSRRGIIHFHIRRPVFARQRSVVVVGND